MSHVVVVTIYGGEQDEQETYGPFLTEQSAEGFADYLVSRPRLGLLYVGHAHVEPCREPHEFFTRVERFGLQPQVETCPDCGQPDNCGDCTHVAA